MTGTLLKAVKGGAVFTPSFNYGEFATIECRACLSLMGLPPPDRLIRLNGIAIRQLQSPTSRVKGLVEKVEKPHPKKGGAS